MSPDEMRTRKLERATHALLANPDIEAADIDRCMTYGERMLDALPDWFVERAYVWFDHPGVVASLERKHGPCFAEVTHDFQLIMPADTPFMADMVHMSLMLSENHWEMTESDAAWGGGALPADFPPLLKKLEDFLRRRAALLGDRDAGS